MARRKRLILSDEAAPGRAPAALPAGIETKAHLAPGLGGPPIARVAAEAAAAAALRDLADSVASARAEGRLVARLPLEAVEADHLVRDRLPRPEEEEGEAEGSQAALVASIRAHGQRMPVEVADLGGGRYGLISGWRRLMALRALLAETGEARFAEVLALVRRPETAADAYVAMVEENELRQGLGHYERARIVARAADLGVFPDERAALRRLFSGAPRARRSKIGSFLAVYRALDAHLRFAAALPERLGLALARALEAGKVAPADLAAALAASPPADAAAEQAVLARALRDDVSRAKHAPDPAAGAPAPAEIVPGVFLSVGGGFTRPVLTLSGPGVDPVFRERLEHWLRAGR